MTDLTPDDINVLKEALREAKDARYRNRIKEPMTEPNFRALCAELVGTWDAKSDLGFSDFRDKISDIVDRARAAELLEGTVNPLPEPPTNEELLELMPRIMRAEFSNTAKLYSTATYGKVKPEIFCVRLDRMALDFAHAVLERWGK